MQEVAICVLNSVHWYEAVFRTHGLSGAPADGMWTSRGKPPPYYSNAVTLDPSGRVAQLAALQDLEVALGWSWTVKDSFSVLDLTSLGFRPLFDAEWIWRDPPVTPTRGRPDTAWRRVTTAAELERWEAAWRENGSPADPRVFLPELLANRTVALFAAYRRGVLVAGCAANRSAEAVGFSNFFDVGDSDLTLAAAVNEVARFGTGLPVVGYEAGETLVRVRTLGFRPVGPLRVWRSDARDRLPG